MDSCSDLTVWAARNRFAAYNGIRVTRVGPDGAEGELTVTEESLNPMGLVHGGYLAALADTVCGTAVAARGRVGVTMDCRMDYLRPASGKTIKCAAAPRKVGRTVAVYSAELTDDGGKTVAIGTFSFYLTGQTLPRFEGRMDRTARGEKC